MDLECPYCEVELTINHDDGFGYEENTPHEMECEHCEKSFVFYTSIMYHFEAKKADCLNGEEHDYRLNGCFPREFSQMICDSCEHRRELTEEERVKYSIGSKQSYIDSLK